MGSPNGLWTSVSGGMAQSQNLDIIANNLANANTAGFKKDMPTFKEYLTSVERPPSTVVDIPRTAFKDSDFYHFDGREHAMVNLNRVHTDHSQGHMRPTNAPFDMAIDGPGFFAVQTPAGIMYTRAGEFKVDGQGTLVTDDGYAVLALTSDPAAGAPDEQNRGPAAVNPFNNPQGVDGKPVLQPIQLRGALAGSDKVHVTPNGEIFSGSEQIATLAVAEFSDVNLLQKTTSTLYKNPEGANVPKIASLSRVRQGFLESSNVNPVSELVELLKANRLYESNMRVIKAYNDVAGKEANEVGKL